MLTALALAASLVGASISATAPGEVLCAQYTTFCVIDVHQPGMSAKPADDGRKGDPKIERHCIVSATGKEVPCKSPLGWFNDADDCYWRKLDQQPPETDVIWAGHYPDGAVYSVSCDGTGAPGVGGWVWTPTDPPGYGGTTPTPQQVAQRAIARMNLAGPTIRMTIAPNEMGVVGVPVWLWTDVGATTWGPNSATATVPGLSVTAKANARKIVWSMGDGQSETCANAGTPYYAGGVTSPTCQHIYANTSAGQPGKAYPVTATTTWDVTWSGGGASGSLTVTRQSTADVRIGEVQVLVTDE